MNDELLQRIYDYIDGELDPTTRTEFEERLARDEEIARAVEEARELEGHLQANFPRQAFLAPRMIPAPPKSRRRFVPIAAAACVMLCGGLAWAAVETGVWDALVAVVSGPSVESDGTSENLDDESDALPAAAVGSTISPLADVTTVDTEPERISKVPSIEARHVIRGRVVSIDGPPIANARVSFSYTEMNFYEGDVYRSTITDGDGRFEEVFEPETHLYIEADGFQIEDRIDLAAADAIEATFQLMPLDRVTGRVLNTDGEPLAGATVYGTFGGRPGRTDVDGRFSMAAESSEHGYAKNLTVVHPEYAPQTIDFSSSEVVAWLQEGAMLEVHVQQGGAPVEGAEVEIDIYGAYINVPGPIVGLTNADGKVAIGPVDVSGEFAFRVTHPDGTVRYLSDDPIQLIAGEAAEVYVDFPYPSTHSIEATVLLDGEPVPHAEIQLGNDEASIAVYGETNASGSKQWDIASGTYDLYAHARDAKGHRVRGGATVLTSGGSSVQKVEIELTSVPRRAYSVFDREGNPVRGFFINHQMHLSYRDDRPIESLRNARLLYSDDRQWAGYPVPLDQSKREWVVNLDVPVSDGASGQVVDEVGQPVAGAFVYGSLRNSPFKTILDGEGETYKPGHRVYARTDEKGRYTFDAMVADAEYGIAASRRDFTNRTTPNGRWASTLYTAGSGGRIDDIVMVRNDAFIEGVVRYDTGRRLQDVAEIRIDHGVYAVMGTQSRSGHFRLAVPKGEYMIAATLNPVERTAPILVEAPADGLVIELPDPETYMTAEDVSAMEGLEEATNGLKQWGIIFKMFAGEHKGKFPSLGMNYGVFCPEMENVLYPEYLTDLRIAEPLLGEGPVRAVYTGYTLATEVEGLAFLDAYTTHGPEGIYDSDIKTAAGYGNGGGDTLFKLRDGIERLLITDINDANASSTIQSTIPLVWEMPNDRGNKGGLVLYLDGHVEWVPYPGPFPMTEAFIQNLARIIGESDEAAGR